MKYHDLSNDKDENQIMANRERLWESLIKKWENGEKWTKDEIVNCLSEIQQFAELDFPESKNISLKQVRMALESVARVAYFVTTSPNYDYREYASSKLYYAIRELQPIG